MLHSCTSINIKKGQETKLICFLFVIVWRLHMNETLFVPICYIKEKMPVSRAINGRTVDKVLCSVLTYLIG